MADGAKLLGHGPCPKCGSSDALALYEDHDHCFAFGCDYHVTHGETKVRQVPAALKAANLLNDQTPFPDSKRGITPETFAHWHYRQGVMNGQKVHIANHFKDGQLVGQKVRFADKTFKVLGKLDTLYGRWLCGAGGKMLVITEGELDALSVSQAQGNKWPVVSVPNGAAGAEKAIRESLDWLEKFEKIVFMFDMDEPGREAAKKCAAILKPGTAFIASLPMKDANDMLKAGMVKELVSAIWQAEEFRPDGVVTLKDVRAEAVRPIEWGRPWPFETLTQHTYGRRDGETYYLGAGTGVGKTDVLTECITFDLTELAVNCGLIFLEQDPRETLRRVAGKVGSKRFHVPDGSWTQQELIEAIDKLEKSPGQLFMYDNFGATDWDSVRERITYMATACNCKHIYLDHLTALAAAEEDERKALEKITAEIAMLAKRLKIVIHVVSHLATPEHGSHEEGAAVKIRHFKGSRAIGFWAHFMFGLERNQQDENESLRHVTKFRILKDRYTGQATGVVFHLGYDPATGRIFETTPEGEKSGPTVEELF